LWQAAGTGNGQLHALDKNLYWINTGPESTDVTGREGHKMLCIQKPALLYDINAGLK
jgi:hypothetical protein